MVKAFTNIAIAAKGFKSPCQKWTYAYTEAADSESSNWFLLLQK